MSKKNLSLLLVFSLLLSCLIYGGNARAITVDGIGDSTVIYQETDKTVSAANEVVSRTFNLINKNDIFGIIYSTTYHVGNVKIKYGNNILVDNNITILDWNYSERLGLYGALVQLNGQEGVGLYYDSLTLEYSFTTDSETLVVFFQGNNINYNSYYKEDISDQPNPTSDPNPIILPEPVPEPTKKPEEGTVMVGKGNVSAFEIDAYNRPYIQIVNKGADGYKVQFINEATKKTALSDEINVVSFSFDKLKADSLYSVRVKPFKYVNGKKKYGSWSSKKYAISGVSILDKSKKTITNKSIRVYWKKVKCAKSYEVYYSKHNNKGWKKADTTKKTSYLLNMKGFSPDWTYYRIIAVTKKGGKTIKSSKKSYRTVYSYIIRKYS